MKHIKLFEDFDLDKFLENPEKELADDNSAEISIGNYVSSYRGKGQVVNMDDRFATIQLANSKGQTVKVPVSALTKLSHAEFAPTQIGNSQAELSDLVDQAQEFVTYLDSSSQINFDTLLGFLQDTVVEVITIKNNDSAYDSYDEYHELVNLVASIADSIQTARPDLTDEVDAALENFPS
jgi:hypothetical protein